MIQLTEKAVDAMRSAIVGAEGQVAGIRIMVDAGGCAGLKYTMGLVAEADTDDLLVERNGIKIFVERRSLALLEGTTVDFITNLEGTGFSFDNPNAKELCSCGKSFA
jgi:iron-sulfur cluster assembly protein